MPSSVPSLCFASCLDEAEVIFPPWNDLSPFPISHPLLIHCPDWAPGSVLPVCPRQCRDPSPSISLPHGRRNFLPPEPAQAGCSEGLGRLYPRRGGYSPGHPAPTLLVAGGADQGPLLPSRPGCPAAARPLPAELRAAGDPPGEGRGRERPGGARGGEAGLGGLLSAAPARGTARLGAAQPGTARLGSALYGSARHGTARLCSARHTSARLGTARLDGAALRWARRSTARLGAAPRAMVRSFPGAGLVLAAAAALCLGGAGGKVTPCGTGRPLPAPRAPSAGRTAANPTGRGCPGARRAPGREIRRD